MGRQVDGTHYEDMPKGYQPFDIIKKLKLDYWQGSVLKYILRAGKKPGVLASIDIRKAVHVLTEYAELLEAEEADLGTVKITITSEETLTGQIAHMKVTPLQLYHCPNGHDIPAGTNSPNRFAWHDTEGGFHHITGTRCEFSGEYVGQTAEEVKDNLPYGALKATGYDQYECIGCLRKISESTERKGRLASHYTRPGGSTWCTLGVGATE